jgi:hypothetical protein
VIEKNAADNHAFGLNNPVTKPLIPEPADPGDSAWVGRVCRNTELVFSITKFGGAITYYSNNSSTAHITPGVKNWIINWEDAPPDNDFNDLVVHIAEVSGVGGVADAPSPDELPAVSDRRDDPQAPPVAGIAVLATGVAGLGVFAAWRSKRRA